MLFRSIFPAAEQGISGTIRVFPKGKCVKKKFCKKKKRVGILTSGGDCPGLNATIRGVAKALYARMSENVQIVGILNGYHGLITGQYKEMTQDDFRGILTLGGTILGTKRTPFKLMRVVAVQDAHDLHIITHPGIQCLCHAANGCVQARAVAAGGQD